MQEQHQLQICRQPWFCDVCGLAGFVEYLPHEDASVIRQRVILGHLAQVPVCPGRVRVRTTGLKDQ